MSEFHEVVVTCQKDCPFAIYRPTTPESSYRTHATLSEDLYDIYYAAKTGEQSKMLTSLAARDVGTNPTRARIAKQEHNYRLSIVQHTPDLEAALIDLDNHCLRERRIAATLTRQPICPAGPSLLTSPNEKDVVGEHRYQMQCGALALQSIQLRRYEYGPPPYLIEQTEFGQVMVALVRSLHEG